MLKDDEPSHSLDYHSCYCNFKCCFMVAFSTLFLQLTLCIFFLWNRWCISSMLLQSLILSYESLSSHIEEDRSSCLFDLGDLCWTPHLDHQWVTELSCTHPYLVFITSDWTVALETVVMSQVTSLWLNEGKKVEQKSTFLFKHATWKLQLSHIHFRAFLGNSMQLCPAS